MLRWCDDSDIHYRLAVSSRIHLAFWIIFQRSENCIQFAFGLRFLAASSNNQTNTRWDFLMFWPQDPPLAFTSKHIDQTIHDRVDETRIADKMSITKLRHLWQWLECRVHHRHCRHCNLARINWHQEDGEKHRNTTDDHHPSNFC